MEQDIFFQNASIIGGDTLQAWYVMHLEVTHPSHGRSRFQASSETLWRCCFLILLQLPAFT